MESLKKIEINNSYEYDYNFGNNLNNIKAQNEYEKKIDTLFDGILYGNKNKSENF